MTFKENFTVLLNFSSCCIEPTEYKLKQECCIEFENFMYTDKKLILVPIDIDRNRHYHMSTSQQIFTNTKNFVYACFIKFINLTEFGYLVANRTNINSQILIIKVLMRGEINFKLYNDKVILWSKKYNLTNSDVEQLFKTGDFKNNPSTNILIESKL